MDIPVLVPMKTRPRNLLAREREQRAMELRRQGWSYVSIATELGVTDMAVIKMVRKVLSRHMTVTAEKAEEVKQTELQRLDALIKANWDFAMAGDEKSAAVILRCMDRRAAYLGLDAPKKVQVEETSDIDRQLGSLIARFKSGRQVPPTVEITGEAEPVDPKRPMERLALPSGARLGEDAHGGGGSCEFCPEESREPNGPGSPDVP